MHGDGNRAGIRAWEEEEGDAHARSTRTPNILWAAVCRSAAARYAAALYAAARCNSGAYARTTLRSHLPRCAAPCLHTIAHLRCLPPTTTPHLPLLPAHACYLWRRRQCCLLIAAAPPLLPPLPITCVPATYCCLPAFTILLPYRCTSYGGMLPIFAAVFLYLPAWRLSSCSPLTLISLHIASSPALLLPPLRTASAAVAFSYTPLAIPCALSCAFRVPAQPPHDYAHCHTRTFTAVNAPV